MNTFGDIISDEDVKKYIGFIYLIEIGSEKYIGSKKFYNNRSKKVKDRKNKKHYTVESNWRTYTSSSDYINQKIQDGCTDIKYSVLKLVERNLQYWELFYQIINDVLNDTTYVNYNIAGKYFRGNI